MRWVIDSCTLISLHKSNLFEFFVRIAKYPIHIDTSVYSEAVEKGIELQYEDALGIREALTKKKIPIIPVDVKNDLKIVGNAGETSCYLLCKDYGVTVTCDRRAYLKFKRLGIPALKLEQYFIQQYYQNQISKSEIHNILKQLENVWAIDSKRHLELFKIISNNNKKGGNIV